MAVYILHHTYKILCRHDHMVELNPGYTAEIIELFQIHSVKRILKVKICFLSISPNDNTPFTTNISLAHRMLVTFRMLEKHKINRGVQSLPICFLFWIYSGYNLPNKRWERKLLSPFLPTESSLMFAPIVQVNTRNATLHIHAHVPIGCFLMQGRTFYSKRYFLFVYHIYIYAIAIYLYHKSIPPVRLSCVPSHPVRHRPVASSPHAFPVSQAVCISSVSRNTNICPRSLR